MFGIDFLSVSFWVGAAFGATFPVFFKKLWAFVKAKLQKDVPASVQADVAKVEAVVAPAVATVEAVATPVVDAVAAKVDAAITPPAGQ